MEKYISDKFKLAEKLYFWAPPVAVIIVIVIDDLIADGRAAMETAFLIWVFSLSSVLFYHSGLLSKYWRSFDEDELEQKIQGLHEMHSPGIWLVLTFVHILAIGVAIFVWRWILKVLG